MHLWVLSCPGQSRTPDNDWPEIQKRVPRQRRANVAKWSADEEIKGLAHTGLGKACVPGVCFPGKSSAPGTHPAPCWYSCWITYRTLD